MCFAGIITPFCWNENASVRVKQNLPLKIAIFKTKISILSQKCSLFKMKLAFTVENQVLAKRKLQILLKMMFCQNENYFFPENSDFQKQKYYFCGI